MSKTRGLVSVFEMASQYLFFTPMDDVHNLDKHFNNILTIAANNHTVINLNSINIDRLHRKMSKLQLHTNNLTFSFNTALQHLHTLNDLSLMDQMLQVLEHTAVYENSSFTSNKVDATNGRVSSSLSTEDLRLTIDNGLTNLSLTPLYLLDMLQCHYPQLGHANITGHCRVHTFPFP